MKKSLAIYDLHSIADRATTYRLQAEPVLRFTNPVGSSVDGAIFFWLGAGDRPEVAVQVYLRRHDDQWLQEFTSLSPSPLIMESRVGPDWTPARGAVELKPVPDAPRPGETAGQRLRQMQAMAQDVAAQDNFRNQGWQTLRLLSKPLARYGKPGTGLIDGALFSFVLGTDPEALLMLEARMGKAGPEWQSGFAPMTTCALECTWKDNLVWTVPWRGPPDRGLNATFHLRSYQPVE